MKEFLKNILKKLGFYYLMQGSYRNLLNIIQKNKNRIAYKKFKGEGFTCNNCGSSYSRFVPNYPDEINKAAITKNEVIAGYGENIYCPNCMCTARERLVLAILQNLMEINGKKVLHLSPEKIVYKYLKEHVNITTGDIEPGFYKFTDRKVQHLDVTALIFEDDTFDIIIGNHIMEHIPDDKKAMKEIYRVLKSKGVAILQVPYSNTISETLEDPHVDDPERQSKLFGQKDHVRIYEFQDYLKRLSDSGFEIKVLYKNDLTAFLKYAIQPNENVIMVYKN